MKSNRSPGVISDDGSKFRFRCDAGLKERDVAVGQAVRAFAQLPVHVGSFEIPFWASWVAAVVTGSLCVWAFRSRG